VASPGTVPVTSRNPAGTIVRDVNAWLTGVPGLVIVQGGKGAAMCAGAWSVMHARSGKRLTFCLPDPESALGFAIAIGGVTDWQRPGLVVKGIPMTPAFLDAAAAYEPWRCSHNTPVSLASMAHDNGVIA
jgi:hypothetical protein